MYDLLLAVGFLLFFVTAVASLLYYRYLKGIYEKYEEAKGVVGDIVLSFNRELAEHESKLDALVRRNSNAVSQSEQALRKAEGYQNQIGQVIEKTESSFEANRKISGQLDDIRKKVDEMSTQYKMVMQRVEKVEKNRSGLPVTTEAKIEAAIPIVRESALAPLTRTELSVLEMLATEEEKTAPEIKERVGLTREHTARLMKKLYVAGYLERDVNKIPYTYRIKDEMRRILGKELRA
ncbi:MAG: MarR family transcriptional regulator [Candidatus Bathyarchaeota archaeon]|nr:MAG: MarR family transcriptional regulator [Candidatus Bathyarchaeota archaeon]